MHLMMILNDAPMAAFAVASGVDRVFVDLETLGKHVRQGHRNTLISGHSLDDVARVRACVPHGALLVRVNPWNDSSPQEVRECVARGADFIMLPMFRSLDEIERLAEVVRGRVPLVPLVETAEAAAAVAAVAAHEAVGELYFGLNDLHAALGCRFMFEPLADGTVESLVHAIRAHGKPFGFGGIARIAEGMLPAELILGEHVRLGSSSVILSRTFHRQARSVAEIQEQMDLAGEIARIRAVLAGFAGLSPADLEANRQRVVQIVDAVRAEMVPSSREASC